MKESCWLNAMPGAFLQNESDDTGYRVDGMVTIPLSED